MNAPLPRAAPPVGGSSLPAEVRGALDGPAARRALSRERRDQLAGDMERVVGYLARPPMAQGLDGATGSGQGGAAAGPYADTGRVGETFGDLDKTVDFPAFVSQLVTGVFSSVVQSSIKQMQSYQDLLQSVARSADAYASEQIPDASARSYLMTQMPGQLATGEDGRLTRAPGATDDGLKAKLGYVPDLTSQQNESVLVAKAKVRLAEQKQKMLATLVLMGINRIVVTDGQINATVNFDVSAEDATALASKTTDAGKTASQDQSQESMSYTVDTASGSFDDSLQRARTRVRVSTSTVTTTDSSTDRINAHAALAGRVKINFKSETFPLDRFSPSSLTKIMGVQRGGGRGAPASAQGAAPATPDAGAKPETRDG